MTKKAGWVRWDDRSHELLLNDPQQMQLRVLAKNLDGFPPGHVVAVGLNKGNGETIKLELRAGDNAYIQYDDVTGLWEFGEVAQLAPSDEEVLAAVRSIKSAPSIFHKPR